MITGPRLVTREFLEELFAWTRNAPMFSSSPEGQQFAEELREVFDLAAEALEQRALGLRRMGKEGQKVV
jgi:hypothetical protein